MKEAPVDLNLVLKKVSRTLYISFMVLPEEIRRQLSAGYLICRAMDSVVDSVNVTTEEKKKILDLFVTSIDGGSSEFFTSLHLVSEKLSDKWEKALLKEFHAVCKMVSSFSQDEKALLRMLLLGVSSGMKTDLSIFSNQNEIRALQTGNDLFNYCHRIGGVPGIFWYKTYNSYFRGKMGHRDIANAAYSIGTGLQLTNIVKDIHEDLLKGRCYFPMEDLSSAGIVPSDLLKKEKIDVFRPILNRWIIQTVDLLDSCEKLVFSIGKTQFALRAAVIWPVYWAMDTLYEASLCNPLEGKVKIGKKRIYSTLFKTPSILVSDFVFQRGYRFRRETLIASIAQNL